MAVIEGGAPGGGNPVLRFFGLHTGDAALGTVLWVAPYLGLLLCGLIGLSLLVQLILPLPLWMHLVALGLAGVNCFFFMARIRTKYVCESPAEGDGNSNSPPEEAQ